MTSRIRPGLARRLDATAFAVAMLGFCWWLHTATGVLAWLSRRQPGVSLPVFAVEAVAVLLIALGLPVLIGRRTFGLVRLVLRGVARLVLLLSDGRHRRPDSAPTRRRQAPGGVR